MGKQAPRRRITKPQPVALVKTGDRRLIICVCVFLAIITVVVFGQTFRYDFVNYDDPGYVYQNTRITGGLNLGNIAWSFGHIHAENWHPLTTLSHMLDCQLHGLKASWHHFTNVLLHGICAILLFLALQRITGALWRSAFVAALFAVHPLHVESVVWIAERKDVLSGVFFMLTLLAYAYYARKPSTWRYVVVAFVLALGLMSKPMLVTTPFVLLLLDYWPLSRMGWGRKHSGSPLVKLFVEKVPLIGMAAVSSTVTFLAQKHAIGWTEQLPMLARINNALASYVIYLRQMFWPTNLAVFHPHPENRLPGWEITLAAIILIGISIAAVILRRVAPYFITGWLWYIGMLVPVIGLVQVGWQAHADRYTYLPQIGLYMALTWGVADLTASWRYQRVALGVFASLVVAALAWTAWLQTSYWRDSETLFKHALAITGRNDVAENNLGILFLDRGDPDQAISHLKTAIDIRSENGPAHDNLAKALLQKGDIAEAMVHYRKFLELEPQNVEARNILGTALIQQHHVKEAIEQWQDVLAIEPENGNAASNLAWVFATSPEDAVRNGPRAVELAQTALRMSGAKIPTIFRVLGAAYAADGRFSEAAAAARQGAELASSQGDPNLAATLQSEIALYETGRALRDPSLSTSSSAPNGQ